MIILPYFKSGIPLIKGMGVSVMEIDIISKCNKNFYTATYDGVVTSMQTNKYTYTNETQLDQKIFKGSKNLYIA